MAHWHRGFVDKDCWPIPAQYNDADRYVWIIDHATREHVVLLRQFRVYLLTCLPTGERYVGVTEKRPAERLADHAYTAFHPRRWKSPVQEAIAKHGVDAFAVETLGIADSIDDAYELECRMIHKYWTLVEEGGLNGTRGGGGTRLSSPVYNYLDLYERGEARVVFRTPRIVKGKVRGKTRNPVVRGGAAPSPCLVEPAGSGTANPEGDATDWIRELGYRTDDTTDWIRELEDW